LVRYYWKVEKTSFDSHTKLSGKKGSLNVFGEGSLTWFLRSWVAEGSKPEHQLYVDIRYSGDNWRFYHRAQSTDAQSVKVTRIDSDVNCSASSYGVNCYYYETVGINLTHDFLLSKKKRGFTIRLLSKKGNSFIIKVPANYTQGYVQSLLPTMRTAGLDVSDTSEENNQSSNVVIVDTPSAPKLPENLKDEKTIASLCNMATKKDANGQLVWDEGKAFESTVAMLKTARIDCGVSADDAVTSSTPTSSSNAFADQSDVLVCTSVRVNLDAQQEAKRRGLSCIEGVTLIKQTSASASQKTSEENTSDNTSSDAMSLSEAKAECASLGFIAGTEKYGDCVMRLMGD